jgi:16S rRNA (cytidine1402-2'-O)-methyltransferase
LDHDDKNIGSLYVVATPIGNLEDVSLRVLRILSEVCLVAAEDTRHTRKLLAHHELHKELISYREQNHDKAAKRIVEVLSRGLDVALVSDAGTPGICDPGSALVAEALEHGCPVVPIPGPSALIAALSGSGFISSQFVFLGFLPRKAGALTKQIEQWADFEGTLVMYESPQRIGKTLKLLSEVLGPRPAVLAREITKHFETFARGTLAQLSEKYAKGAKGELVLMVKGMTKKVVRPHAEWQKVVDALRNGQSWSPAEIAKVIGKLSGLGRKTVYSMVPSQKEDGEND